MVFLPESASFPTTNYPELSQDIQARMFLGFDAVVSESCFWTFAAPQGLTAPLALVITYRTGVAITGTAIFGAAIEAISDGDATDTYATASFDATNTSAAATVPAATDTIDQISITLTNADTIAAGDYCRLRVNRDIADTAAGDLQILMVELRDAA